MLNVFKNGPPKNEFFLAKWNYKLKYLRKRKSFKSPPQKLTREEWK